MYPCFEVNQISLQHSDGLAEGRLCAKNQLDPSGWFAKTRLVTGTGP